MKKVLVACEESQRVCVAFRERWYVAYSCDLKSCSNTHPEWHLKEDVKEVIKKEKWDMVIAFPPCTHLASSGARYFSKKRLDGRQQEAINFFLFFVSLDVPLVAIENPIGIMSTIYRQPDQIVEPWWFGDPVQKATCLWLKGLPPLYPTVNGFREMLKNDMGRELSNMPPSKQRATLRSRTPEGMANAMAEQWGELL